METPTVAQVLKIIERLAPTEAALPEDPVGLQCGDPERPAGKVMVALDANGTTIKQALAAGAGLLVTHHPLLFESLGPRNMRTPTGDAFTSAVRGGLAVYSAHTNLDASPHGINAALADIVNLREREILAPTGPDSFKVVIFAPKISLEPIRKAVFQAGGGRIGPYSECSFAVFGEGTFLGDGTARPAVGSPGRRECVSEIRLEVLAPEGRLAGVLEAVRKVHPYETPVMDLFPLKGKAAGVGIGITGLLPSASAVGDIALLVKKALRLKAARVVGKPGRKVSRVAVCGGSGGSLLPAAWSSGAQLYISGDIKFHEARSAEENNLSILDVGHFAPERFGMLRFGEKVHQECIEKGWTVTILYATEKDPFTVMT